MKATPSVTLYQARFKEQFRALNLEWIEKYFKVEQKDLDQVNNPEECLRSGGQIFFVLQNDQVLGTCAMYKNGTRSFELAKMAVAPGCRGLGYGDLLMQEAENWAKAQGAKEILILSNTVLQPAIALYKKHGYLTTHLGPHPDYERCNIEMKKNILPAVE